MSDKKINIGIDTRELETQVARIKSMFDRIGVSTEGVKGGSPRETASQFKQLIKETQVQNNNTLKELKEILRSNAREFKESFAGKNIPDSARREFQQAQKETRFDIGQAETNKVQLSGLLTSLTEASKESKNQRGDESRERGDFSRAISAYGLKQGLQESARAIGPTTTGVLSGTTSALASGYTTLIPVLLASMYGMALQTGVRQQKAVKGIERGAELGEVFDLKGERQSRMEELGISIPDFYEKLYQTRQQTGTAEGSNERTEANIRLQKALDISEQNLSNFNSLGRTLGVNNEDIVQKVISSLGTKGAKGLDLSKMDLTATNKYLEKIYEISQDQYERTGAIDIDQAIKSLGSFMNMGGAFKDENVASSLRKGFGSTFSTPSNLIQEVYNRQALINANPELAGDPLALRQAALRQSTGSAGNYSQVLTERIKGVLGRYGSRDLQVQALESLSGGALNAITGEDFLKEFQANPNILNKNEKGGYLDMFARAQKGTGAFEKTEAQMTNFFSERGDAAVSALTNVVDALGGDVGALAAAISDLASVVAGKPTQTTEVGERRVADLAVAVNKLKKPAGGTDYNAERRALNAGPGVKLSQLSR